MIPVNITLRSEICDCLVCGNHTASAKSAEFQFHIQKSCGGVFVEDARGGPICEKCQNDWSRLDARIGRAASFDEFLIWTLHEASKGTKRGRRFLTRVADASGVELGGDIFGDLAEAIVSDAGHSLRFVCPCCGEKGRLT